MNIILILLIIGLPLLAQIFIKISYENNSRIKNSKELTGYDVARKILDKNGLNDLLIVETNGYLTDHYDPNRKVIKLSRNIYGNDTISSMAVAAHEVGHAIQDKEGYFFLRLRTFIFPIVSFISRISWLVILIGFFFEIVNAIYLGIIIVSASVIFELVTLPVEINASKRAIKELNSLNLITGEEDKVKNVLTAAALTYVAGTLAEILQLIRLIGILKDND
jgi:Zn-dependent membrane protease YugP